MLWSLRLLIENHWQWNLRSMPSKRCILSEFERMLQQELFLFRLQVGQLLTIPCNLLINIPIALINKRMLQYTKSTIFAIMPQTYEYNNWIGKLYCK